MGAAAAAAAANLDGGVDPKVNIAGSRVRKRVDRRRRFVGSVGRRRNFDDADDARDSRPSRLFVIVVIDVNTAADDDPSSFIGTLVRVLFILTGTMLRGRKIL